MTELFDNTRHYTQDDPLILDLLGSKEKQSQMRYYGRYPIHYKLGRKIVMTGHALNAWAHNGVLLMHGKTNFIWRLIVKCHYGTNANN